MTDTVIFDMDGVLVDSEPLWREAMAEVFATLPVSLTEKDFRMTMGMRTPEVVQYWHSIFRWKNKTPEQVTEEIFEAVIYKLKTKGKIMAGVEWILALFKLKKYKIGLASSSPVQLIEFVLSHFELKHFFDTYHSGEHEEYGKPHPAVYLSCAEELKSEPRHCLVFEDSVTGLIAAKAAQMKAVAVPDEENRDDPRYAIADLKLLSLEDFSVDLLNLFE